MTALPAEGFENFMMGLRFLRMSIFLDLIWNWYSCFTVWTLICVWFVWNGIELGWDGMGWDGMGWEIAKDLLIAA